MISSAHSRLNEIFLLGIKETGIDKNPICKIKYGYAVEHGTLIREIEELELLEELEEILGGEEQLGKLIFEISQAQELYSPRYKTQDYQNFNFDGTPIGKRAYGITTQEFLQKEIQKIILKYLRLQNLIF